MRHGDVGGKLLGHGSAAVALLAAIVCIVATPSRARADQDITNDWVVTLNVARWHLQVVEPDQLGRGPASRASRNVPPG